MKFKNIEIGDKPSLEQLTKCIWTMRLNISSRKMFDYYEGRNWVNRNGSPIEDLEHVIAGINNVPVFKRELGDLRAEYEILRGSKGWKEYISDVRHFYNNECKICHKKEGLEVHHSKYIFTKNNMSIPAKLPWDYQMDEVILLCHECHEKKHNVCVYSEHSLLSGYDE